MRTPRIKAGVNNENNTSKCPHKPRTNPLMLICRPGVPFPPPHRLLQRGQWPNSKCKRSSRKRIPQLCCSPSRRCRGSGREEQLGLSRDQRCHLSTPWPHRPQHRSGPGGSSDMDRRSLRWWARGSWHSGKLRVAC